MYSRVTQLEIDTTRIEMDKAVQLFREEVLPAVRELDGYQGTYVLANPDGKALLLTFWETEEAAEAHQASGFTPSIWRASRRSSRSPPGRERYAVVLTDELSPPGT